MDTTIKLNPIIIQERDVRGIYEFLLKEIGWDRDFESTKEAVYSYRTGMLAASILKKEQRIAEIMGNIQKLLAKSSPR